MQALRDRFKGTLITPEAQTFRESAQANLWNLMRPSRLPDLIARVADVEDVQTIVRYAREKNLKVVVRGGGHNWCCPSLRNGGILLDLAALTSVISIDKENKRAVVEPIISNRDMIKYLHPYDLAYPTGHCPTVKMSGYLLSGGMSWNHGVWGPGCGSVEAIEMVTADGELVTASRNENQDLFWAARGAGCGFFAVAVRYHLRLYPLPKAIACSVYYFPAGDIVQIAEWLDPLADKLTPNVELSLWLVQAPPDLVDQCKAHNGKVCMVTASIFADSQAEAEAAVASLETCPLMENCLSKIVAEPSNFEGLFDASESLWPEPMRCQTDAMYSDQPLADVIGAVTEHFIKAPSPKSVLMFAVYTGGGAPALPPDASFSMTGKLYGGPWTMWDASEEDTANIVWHKELMRLLDPLMEGHYVSETDTVTHPEYVKRSFSPDNLSRLEQLRHYYDPTGVLFGFHDAFG